MTFPTVKDTSQRLPSLHRHSCFQHTDPQERWGGPLPDGIIQQVGDRQYLVMFRGEAEKRGGGDKVALLLTIESFDRRHIEVECPQSWLNHSRRN